MTNGSSSVLSCSDLSLALGGKKLLQKVTFQVKEGDFVYLVGATGSGKSSLLRLIYADLSADAGNISVAGQVLNGIDSKQIPFLRRKLGIVFQDFQLLPDKTAEENLTFAMRATGWTDRDLIRRRLKELLHELSLEGKEKQYPHQLSGGEQQRVSIARALINQPPLVLADEPTGNLDPKATLAVMAALRSIAGMKTAVLMATHEYGLLRQYPGRVLWLKDGYIQDFATSAAFLEAYQE